MNRFVSWWERNINEIQWFLIGWCLSLALGDFARGDWSGMLLNLGLCCVNYYFNKR
jgi:hypothetical protein